AISQVWMIDVLFLEGLQSDLRFPQDLVLPRQQLGAKIIALPVVHERLFFRGSIILQLFQGQPIFACKAERKIVRPRAPYIAAGCDRQYRLTHWESRPGRRAQPMLQCRDGAALSSVTDRETGPNMGRTLDFVGECNCEVLEGNRAFAVGGGQKLVGPEAELSGPLARHEQGRGRQEGPVQLLFLPQQVEKGAALLGFG